MIKKITVITCDCCQKQVENEKDLFSITIPVPYIGERSRQGTTITTFNVCKDCKEKICDKIQEVAEFQEVWCGGRYIGNQPLDSQ